MPSTASLLTAEDLLNLPDQGKRYELVRGELRVMAPAGFEHGDIGLELGARMRGFAKKRQLGKVVGAETGFILSRNPDHVRAPDVAFVQKDRLSSHPIVQFFPGAPDLAVEVVSPHDTVDELQEKIEDYQAHGVRLIWIIYPRNRTAQIHRLSRPPEHVPASGTLLGEDLLPGFECPLAELFE